MSRAERRRQEKADLKLIERGLDVLSRNPAQIVSLMRVLSSFVEQARGEHSVDPLMEFFYANMQQAGRRLSEAPIACRKGCAHCCTTWVAASAPEVIFAAKVAAARAAAVSNAEPLVAGKSFDARGTMVVRCPMLEQDICQIYAARPLVCRTATSVDADLCRRAYLEKSGEDIPTPTAFVVLKTGYTIALHGALRHAGLHYTPHEFIGAVKNALDDPALEQEWLAGKDVFAGIPRDPNGDIFQAEWAAQLYRATFSEN